MKMQKSLSVSLMALALAATACVDDNYDFSDIDTTAQVKVNDLIVPINIDAIQLRSVIDIDEEDPDNHIKVIDNAYAYVQDGDFTTGDISVPEVRLKAVDASCIDVDINLNLPPISVGVALSDIPAPVPAKVTEYNFNAHDISKDICGLSKVMGDMTVTVRLNISGVESLAESYTLKDFKLHLPTGIILSGSDVQGAEYQAADNTLLINGKMPSDGLTVTCTARGINIPDGAFDAQSHSLTMQGEVGIVEGGNITVHPRSNPDLSSVKGLKLKVDYTFSDMEVKSVDGTIKYSIDDVNVPEINISDLPDVLAQPGTNLVLANPCLYLQINNPLHVIGAYAQTGFEITAYHGDDASLYRINDDYFRIEAKETDNFCFSPKMPANPDADFADGCTHVAFTSLSNVLSGDGLPDMLKVDLTDPCMPQQQISNFLLGHNYGNVHGLYKFVAPLQFGSGTQITYSDIVDGWSSEDLEKITVTNIEISLNVSTDVPIAVDFTGYPIDKDGKHINNVMIEGAKIDANAKDQQLRISIKGEITDLDGIEFVAKASATSDGQPLSPDMNIILTNVRPSISGYYETEL